MNYFYFVGIDIGKNSFDASLFTIEQDEIAYRNFKNNQEGITMLVKWVKSKAEFSATLFCAEDMGTYVNLLSLSSLEKGFSLALVCPLSLKKSLGIARGKNDVIDAKRIALYACMNFRKLKLFKPVDSEIIELKTWLNIREQIVKQKVAIKQMLHNLDFSMVELTAQREMLLKNIEDLERQISEVERRMKVVISRNSNIDKNYRLLTSVTGVAIITASVLICSTNNFADFSNHRKFACYCGVAPFENSSGISVRGRTQVSSMANRKVKTMLSRAAMSAINHDPQIKAYYQRKIDEGKPKAVVANAVKAKIIARCFAVVRRGIPFITMQA